VYTRNGDGDGDDDDHDGGGGDGGVGPLRSEIPQVSEMFRDYMTSVQHGLTHCGEGEEGSAKCDRMQSLDEGFTIVLNTYSRDACIEELVPHWLSCNPRQLRVVWNDVGRPLPDFINMASLNSSGVLVIDKHVSRNVTNRFMPFEYQTRAIFNIDDDITYSCSDLWTAYAQWNAQPKRVVGFANSVRLIDGREPRGYYMDDAHYNAIFVSKGAFLHRHYYDLYFSDSFATFRDEVNLRGTGEDILMSFVHASANQFSRTPALECITAAYHDNLPCSEDHGAKKPLYFETGEANKRKAVVDLLNASHFGLPRLGQLPCSAHLHDA
jgi:hypothetical protein